MDRNQPLWCVLEGRIPLRPFWTECVQEVCSIQKSEIVYGVVEGLRQSRRRTMMGQMARTPAVM